MSALCYNASIKTLLKISHTYMSETQETIYDESFVVTRQRWGTFVSKDLEGNGLITSLTEERCIEDTRWFLKAKQEGFPKDDVNYEGVVGGKL